MKIEVSYRVDYFSFYIYIFHRHRKICVFFFYTFDHLQSNIIYVDKFKNVIYNLWLVLIWGDKMIIRVNLKNCELYLGNLARCIRYNDIENLKIVVLKPYKDNVLLVKNNNMYFTFEDYIHKLNNPIATEAKKVGDLSVVSNSLKKIDKKNYENIVLVLRRN